MLENYLGIIIFSSCKEYGVSYISCLFFYSGKAIPLQVLTGPEGSRKLRFTDIKTIGT
jgi:hypothetical protein